MKLMDQSEVVDRIDTLRARCAELGIDAPAKSKDIFEDLEALESLVPQASAYGKPAATKATLDPVAYAEKASEIYEALPPERRSQFLAKNEAGIREMLLAADRHERNTNLT